MDFKDVKNLGIDYETEKQVLNLHSSAIHVENKLGLKARLAWFYMVYRSFSHLGDSQKFTIQISDLKKAINYTSKNNKILKDLLRDLTQTSVEWDILEKDDQIWEVNSLLSGCKIDKGTGKITFSFSPFIQERLFNPKLYAKINLIVSKRFKSKYSLTIYCLAVDYLQIKYNYGEKNLTIDELRKYLGLGDNEYARVVDLNKDIIKKAEKEINVNSDLNISIIPIRTINRKITGFKFKMSIKEEHLESYRPQKLIRQNNNDKQTNLFDSVGASSIQEIEIFKEKKELIKVTNQELKKYFSDNKISIRTDTVQNKLEEIQETFQENFEDYLVFLMNYTNQEAKKKSINNLSGFYVGLLKDDSQLDNYILFFQQQQQRKQSQQIKIKSMIENELQKQYDKYLSEDFDNYLVENIDRLENKIIKIIKSTLKPGDFILDVIIERSHKGIIDKTLITASKPSTKAGILVHLRNYKDELNYKTISFDEWKNQEITEEILDDIEYKIVKSF